MSEKAIVENANLNWNNAFNNKDIKALVKLYADDAILSPGNGVALAGHEEIEALFKSFIDGGVNSHALTIIEVGGSDDFIYQVAKWSAKGPEVDGEKAEFGGVTTTVFKKSNDGEYLAHSHVWNVN